MAVISERYARRLVHQAARLFIFEICNAETRYQIGASTAEPWNPYHLL